MPLAELRPAPAHAARSARLDPVPHVLLRGGLGLLPEPAPARRASRRRLRRRASTPRSRPGHLTYGELVLPGRQRGRDPDLDPRLPSVAGRRQPVGDRGVGRSWRARLAGAPAPRHTLRFLYAPGTIGAITWLARNRSAPGGSRHGLTLHLPRRRPSVHVQAHRRRRRRHRSRGCPRARAGAAPRTRSSTSSPTATTSGSSTPPAFVCRSDR